MKEEKIYLVEKKMDQRAIEPSQNQRHESKEKLLYHRTDFFVFHTPKKYTIKFLPTLLPNEIVLLLIFFDKSRRCL